MGADERIRKQVYELQPEDLERFPIWEFALDEEGEPDQDEATVRPRPDLREADPAEGMFIVGAEFITKDGTPLAGYVTPSSEDSIGFLQPTVVTPRGQVNFWLGAFPPQGGELDEAYEVLGKSAEEIFPVAFKAVVAAQGVDLRGEIPAFLHFASPADQRIIEVK